MYDWKRLNSRRLHPDIGVPGDDTQGLPFLYTMVINSNQNFGLTIKKYSGSNSITGFLFTANTRYILGSGEVKDLSKTGDDDYGDFVDTMCAIDGLNNHIFATTATGIINAPLTTSGKKIGWDGGQWANELSNTHSRITFFNYLGSNYIGFGNGYFSNFCIFKPGGVVDDYSGYAPYLCQPLQVYNGLYTLTYGTNDDTYDYGFITPTDAPALQLYERYFPTIIPFSYTKSAIMLNQRENGDTYGYDGVNNPELSIAWQKIPYPLDSGDVFGFDPITNQLLSISTDTISINGKEFYPVYVYDHITLKRPEQTVRSVRNYTLDGRLNWRK